MAKCKRIGCTEPAIDRGHCERHASTLPPQKKRTRREWHNLYNTSWWKKARVKVLARTPLCANCYKYGYVKAAVDVDHIIDHKGDKALFFDYNNLQGLCKVCHARKTNEENRRTQ